MRVGLPKFPPLDLPPRWVSLLAAALLMLICLAVFYVLGAARDADRLSASNEAGNIGAAITQNIQRTIELYDLSLQGAAEAVNDLAVMTAPPKLRNAVLFDKAATASFLGEIDLLDETGQVIAASSSLNPPPRNDADRDYFRIHAQVPNFGLYISRPLTSRTDKAMFIALSRRVSKPDGSFGGIVVGTLRLEYLHQLFHQMKLGQNGSITLFRNDGSIVMREAYDPALIGARRPPPILFDLASRSSEGEYESVSVVDGVRRLVRFRRVGNLPLIASVGLATDEIYSQSRRRVMIVGGLVGACCVLIVILLLRLGRELRRRKEAEDALRALVDTDALTGLANRRRFDRALDAAWRRASVQGETVALIMIDVDHFKSYNDTLGHAAGDDALRQVARCFAEHPWRAEDLPARYGGEEFAIILPGLTRDQVIGVAESLRRAVLELGLSHPMAPIGRVTISAGCATRDASDGGRAQDLVTAADTALYWVKRAGRNACEEYPNLSDVVSLAS